MNTNVKVIGLTRLGIKPESTAQETDALYHSAELLLGHLSENTCKGMVYTEIFKGGVVLFSGRMAFPRIPPQLEH